MNTDREHSEQQTEQSRWGFRGMTVRDWLQLLIVPLALVVISFLFTAQQDQRQQRTEAQRAKAERELAEQRAQDEALQAYLDQMSQLMLDRKLLEAEPGDPVHTLAQARTSTVILRLDAEHNESVTRFLIDSGLAVSGEGSPRLLREITLSHATLSGAFLFKADLSGADLSGANLSGADLGYTNLRISNLYKADLSGANLYSADLSDAGLILANLSDAFLIRADLSGANLSDAVLSGAAWDNADLSGALGITNEELAQHTKNYELEGATMPNGQKYEDWLKDKKAQGKDEKNEGSP
jgi:cell division protein FtsB